MRADQMHEAATVARSGASDLYTARSRMQYGVEDARTAGFDVGQDLSVTDRSSGGSLAQRAARQAQAQTLADTIRQRAGQLVDLDQHVAAKITAAVTGISDAFPHDPHFGTPPKDNHVHAVDNHTYKQDPSLPPPGPQSNPFAGWTEEQKKQVATEIAHGHAWEQHKADFPRGWSERDLARSIYDAMKDPETRIATSIDSGGLALLRPDGTIIFINPQGGDYGTAFVPKPRPGDKWRTPLEYFEQQTRALEPLPPPSAGRLPPLTPGEMAPPPPLPAPEPAPPPRPAPSPPVQEPAPVETPAPHPGPPLGSFGGGGGGGIPGLGIGGLHTPTEEVD
jgi:hypothetical protein